MGKRRDYKAHSLLQRGNRKSLGRLLRRHPELKTSHTAMLVHEAMWHHQGMLRWLLERGVSPNCHDEVGNTALMYAASDGDLVTMKLLIEFGVDLHAVNESSENAFGYAVTWEQPHAVELLVTSGVDVNEQVDSGPERTQLDCAEQSKWTEMAATLRKLGGKRFSELRAPNSPQNNTPK